MDEQEEIDSLKARLAALEKAQPPAVVAAAAAARSGNNGCLIAVLVAVGGLAVLLALGSTHSDPPATPVENDQCDEAAAEGALVAIRPGLVRGETVEAPDGLVVMVRPRAWLHYDYDQQEQLAALYDCAIAGKGKHLTMIRFRYERNGEDLARFEATRLLSLRQQGYGTVNSAAHPGS